MVAELHCAVVYIPPPVPRTWLPACRPISVRLSRDYMACAVQAGARCPMDAASTGRRWRRQWLRATCATPGRFSCCCCCEADASLVNLFDTLGSYDRPMIRIHGWISCLTGKLDTSGNCSPHCNDDAAPTGIAGYQPSCLLPCHVYCRLSAKLRALCHPF